MASENDSPPDRAANKNNIVRDETRQRNQRSMGGPIPKFAYTGAVKAGHRPSLRKVSAYCGAFLAAFIIAGAVFLLVFGRAFVNGYAKSKLEKTFAKAQPGFVMQIGHLGYSMGADEVTAQLITVRGTNAIFKAERISLRNVHWISLVLGKADLAGLLDQASLDATNLEAEFPKSHYELRCARVQASVPNSEITAEGTELRPLLGNEDFFSAYEFRTTRFKVIVPKCRVSGLAYDQLLGGTSYRARSIEFSGPTFDALVDRDKPSEPFVKSPLMVHEALAAILKPLQVDSLRVTNGSIKYSEQVVAGGAPGILTFTAVSLSAQGIANRGSTQAAITLQAQGNLMDAGTMKVLMTIPIMPTNFSLHYSGSLSAMDLTRLDAFLDIAEHTRIKSGAEKEADFEIDVTAGEARGRVRASYQRLEIAFLNKKSGDADGMQDRATSFLANMLKIRSSNGPESSKSPKEGEVHYVKKPNEEFLQFLWFALRTGVLDIISH